MMLRKFHSFMTSLAFISSYIGVVWILIIMFIICFDISGRLFFQHPIIGTPEIVQNSLPAIAFLMMPWATYLGQHVRSTILKARVPEKAAYSLEIFAYLLGSILFLGIIISAWDPMLWATKIKDFQGEGLRVPIYPIWWFIIFGSALSLYQCLFKIIKAVSAMMGKSKGIKADGGGIQL